MSQLDFSSVLQAWPLFLDGLLLTIFLTVLTSILGTGLGILCVWGLSQRCRLVRSAITCYVELFRNTPFIIQIFFIYFGLASVGLRMSALAASLLGLILNLAAYACEIIRAGVDATPRGQIEAAQSLSLTRFQVFRKVIVAPALARVWPGLVSQLIILMLATSVCSQISTAELSYAANFVAGKTFRSFESFASVTLIYLLLAIFMRNFLLWLGPRFVFGPARF